MVLPITKLVEKFGEAGCKVLTITLISDAGAEQKASQPVTDYRLNDKPFMQTYRFLCGTLRFVRSLRLGLLICN